MPPIGDFLVTDAALRAAGRLDTASACPGAITGSGGDPSAARAATSPPMHRTAQISSAEIAAAGPPGLHADNHAHVEESVCTRPCCPAMHTPGCKDSGACACERRQADANCSARHREKDAWAAFRVPGAVLQRAAWCIDVVTPDCRSANCFTKSYGQYTKGAGSVLATRNLHVLDSFGNWGHREKVRPNLILQRALQPATFSTSDNTFSSYSRHSRALVLLHCVSSRQLQCAPDWLRVCERAGRPAHLRPHRRLNAIAYATTASRHVGARAHGHAGAAILHATGDRKFAFVP